MICMRLFFVGKQEIQTNGRIFLKSVPVKLINGFNYEMFSLGNKRGKMPPRAEQLPVTNVEIGITNPLVQS